MDAAEPRPTNRLSRESSPYLLQHASNPVDWYPWSEEAFQHARQQDRPVLLSIGYSSCHWCHVMAHESFEDREIAAVMNELFVNIKVDREERPDLDKVYQTAQQLINRRSGGWPLTVFLTPDREPFFAGTYFPPEARYGMPGFADVLRRISHVYQHRRDAISQQGVSLTDALRRVLENPGEGLEGPLDAGPVEAALGALEGSFDQRFGGFGDAPKFPHATALELLLAQDREQHLRMGTFSLERMSEGGLYDHLAGGFYRYSVDQQWRIPHFEKMLYDNGPLLALCARAHAITGDALHRERALETADWAFSEMQSPEGGFFATLDADTDGREGGFYVWDAAALRQALASHDYALFSARFGLAQEPNFEGRWHLNAALGMADTAATTGLSVAEAATRLRAMRAHLTRLRSQRTRPARDEKILTAWNAMMIRGLAIAARHLNEPRLGEAAGRALDFIRSALWSDDGLQAVYKDGQARLPAYLDDHALLMDAVLELLQFRWRSSDLRFCCALADVLLEQFQDPEQGGFFFTSDRHERLLARHKPVHDESLPAGNAVAASALTRLGHLLGEARYLRAAEKTLRWAWPTLERQPGALCAMALALQGWARPAPVVILRGEGAELARWHRSLGQPFRSGLQVFAIPGDGADLPAGLSAKAGPAAGVVAYLCRGLACSPPNASLEALQAQLEANMPPSHG